MQWNDSLAKEAERATLVRAAGPSREGGREPNTSAVRFVGALWAIERGVDELRKTRDRVFTKSVTPGFRHASRLGHGMVEALAQVSLSEQNEKVWQFPLRVEHALSSAEMLGVARSLREASGGWDASDVESLNRWVEVIRQVESGGARRTEVRQAWRSRMKVFDDIAAHVLAQSKRCKGSMLAEAEVATISSRVAPRDFVRVVVRFATHLKRQLGFSDLPAAWMWDGDGDGCLRARLVLILPVVDATVNHDVTTIALDAWQSTNGVSSGVLLDSFDVMSRSTAVGDRQGVMDSGRAADLRRQRAASGLAYSDLMNSVRAYVDGPRVGCGDICDIGSQSGLLEPKRLQGEGRHVRPSADTANESRLIVADESVDRAVPSKVAHDVGLMPSSLLAPASQRRISPPAKLAHANVTGMLPSELFWINRKPTD